MGELHTTLPPASDTYYSNGLQHIVSTKYNEEANKQETNEDVSIRLYIQKFFVTRLDSSKSGVKSYIGGDIPMMYYNEIMSDKKVDESTVVSKKVKFT